MNYEVLENNIIGAHSPERLLTTGDMKSMGMSELAAVSGMAVDYSMDREVYEAATRRTQLSQLLSGNRPITDADQPAIDEEFEAITADIIVEDEAPEEQETDEISREALAELVRSANEKLGRDTSVSEDEVTEEIPVIVKDQESSHAPKIPSPADPVQPKADDARPRKVSKLVGRARRAASSAVITYSPGPVLLYPDVQPRPERGEGVVRERIVRMGKNVGRLAMGTMKWGSAFAVAGALSVFIPNAVESMMDDSTVATESAVDAQVNETINVTIPVTTLPEAVISPETIPAVAPVVATIESTSTTTSTTTTTEAPRNPNSIFEAIRYGETSLGANVGAYVATFEAPTICLSDVKTYVANKSPLTADQQAWVDNSPNPSRMYKDLRSTFDPIYYTIADETPQEPCEDMAADPNRPDRATRLAQGSSNALTFTYTRDILPVIDIDTRGVIPGQVGNVVGSGHFSTESAAFANLGQLSIGDEVYMTGDDGIRHTYAVEGFEEVLPDEAGLQTILNYTSPSGNEKTMTLYTCDDGSRVRLVVRLAHKA